MSETCVYRQITSPLGPIRLTGTPQAISGLYLEPHALFKSIPQQMSKSGQAFELACEQLEAYFSGKSLSFALATQQPGTEFQESVWQALTQIPPGTTVSYGELARRIGKPKAVRALGSANGANRIGIIIPCHRVIGADGRLSGYAGGTAAKDWLLRHERHFAAKLNLDTERET